MLWMSGVLMMSWRWLYGELQNIQNIFESLTKSDELSKTNFLTGIPEDDKINFLKVTEILKEYLKPSLHKRSRLGLFNNWQYFVCFPEEYFNNQDSSK